MALRRRGKTYWVDITVGGRRIQRSARTQNKQAAQEYHDALAAKLWREGKLGERPDYTWKEAVVKFLRETEHKKSHDRDKARLAILHPILGHLKLSQITRDVIDEAADQIERERETGSAATNRYLAVIRTILRRAEREWGWVDRAPAVRLRREPEGRIRWLTGDEYVRLMRALPDHLMGPVEFALQTGLRQSNILGLRWEQVDMPRRVAWVSASRVKTGKALRVPLNTKALEVLDAARGKHAEYVFTRDGDPVKAIRSKEWADTLERAKIKDFRFHDTRHTWASWHVMNGTSLQKLMELAGWSTYQMAMRYAHLAPAHLDEAAENVAPPSVSPLREAK